MSSATRRERAARRAEGAEIARRLRHAAIGLACSKATEFSPLIGRYELLAAKVALLALWPDQDRLQVYEDAVCAYRRTRKYRPLAEEYESFREAFVRGAQPTRG